MLKPIASDPAMAELQKEVSLSRLKRACAEFESIFINYMLKSMRTTVDDDLLLGNSNESKIIKSMFDENLALGIAKGGGLGLGKILFESLKPQNCTSDKIMNYR